MSTEPTSASASLHHGEPSAARADHHKISFTAKLVALGRSSTDLPFARDISELVGAELINQDMTRSTGTAEFLPAAMVRLVEVRYLSLVAAIKRSGCGQVLEFASGVSLRGLSMAQQNPNLTYVETDLADLTAQKRRIIETVLDRHALQEPKNHHVEVVNILAWDQIEKVLGHLNPSEPVAVVHEGLFMYLDAAEKELAARHIAKILDRFGGVWITPDFSPMADLNELMAGDGEEAKAVFARFMSAIEERTGRNFAAHSFASEDEAQEFCEALGFRVEVDPQIDGTFDISSVTAEQLRDGTLAKMKRDLHLWTMRRPAKA